MGDLTIKSGNLAINYGSLSTYNGTSTWTLKHGYDNNLSFITDGTGAAVFSNLSIPGYIKLEGTSDIHGIIFPDGSHQKKASWVSSGPQTTITSVNTSNTDMTLGFTYTNYCEKLDPTRRLINIIIQCDGVGNAGTGDVQLIHNMTLPFSQNVNGTLYDNGGSIYHVIWNTGTSKLMYLNGGIYTNVTPTTPLVFSSITAIQLNGVVTES